LVVVVMAERDPHARIKEKQIEMSRGFANKRPSKTKGVAWIYATSSTRKNGYPADTPRSGKVRQEKYSTDRWLTNESVFIVCDRGRDRRDVGRRQTGHGERTIGRLQQGLDEGAAPPQEIDGARHLRVHVRRHGRRRSTPHTNRVGNSFGKAANVAVVQIKQRNFKRHSVTPSLDRRVGFVPDPAFAPTGVPFGRQSRLRAVASFLLIDAR
jgi:hypothetical protein